MMVEVFSKNLKELMKAKGLSASQLAKSCLIPRSTLSEWLAGRTPVLDASLVRLANCLGVSLEFLLTGEHPEERVVKDLVKDLDEGFVRIHQGVYRFTVEKLTKSNSKDDKA